MHFDEIKRLNQIIEEKDKEIFKLKECLESKSSSSKTPQQIQDFYEEILALMPGHVYWQDTNNVFLGCNMLQAQNARLSSRQDIVGKTNFDMPWKEQADELNKINDQVMQTGIPHSYEEYAVMNDGTSIYLSNKTPIRDKNNTIVGLLGVSIDITERKKMEVSLRHAKEQAETANKIKSEFIANMNQNLLIPLNGIVELSKALAQHLTDNTQACQQAHGMHESSKQLLKLLTNSFHLISNDTIQESDYPYLQPLNLRQIIQEMCVLLYPEIHINHIDLKTEIALDVPEHFISDDTKLRRILLILLVYCIKRIKSSTLTIKIDLLATDCAYAQLQFSIIDTTSSMPFDSIEFISQDTNLQIAQKYVGILGGEIQYRSEAKHNTLFDFILSLKIA